MTDVSTQQLVAANDRATDALLAGKFLKRIPNTDSLFVLTSLYNESLILKQVSTLSEAIQCGGLMCLATEFLYPVDITTMTDQEATQWKAHFGTIDPSTIPTLAVAGATMIDYLRQPECRSIYIPTMHFNGDTQNIGNGMSRASLALEVEYVACDVSTPGRPWVYYAMVGNMDVGWGVSGSFVRPCTCFKKADTFATGATQATDKRSYYLGGAGIYREIPDLPRAGRYGTSLFVGVKPIPYPKMLHELVTSVIQNQVKDEDPIIKSKMTDAVMGWKARTPNTVVGVNTLLICGGGFSDGSLNWISADDWPKTDHRIKPGMASTGSYNSYCFSAVSRSLVGEIDVKMSMNDSLYFGCTQSTGAPGGMWGDGTWYFDSGPYPAHPITSFIDPPSSTPDDDTVEVTASPTDIRVKLIQMGAPVPVKDRMCKIPVLNSPWFVRKGGDPYSGVVPGEIPVVAGSSKDQVQSAMASRFYEHSCLSLPVFHKPFIKTESGLNLASWLAKAAPGFYYDTATGNAKPDSWFRVVDGQELVQRGPPAEVISTSPPAGATGTSGSPPPFPLVIERYLAAEMWQGDGVRFTTETVRALQKQVYDSV